MGVHDGDAATRTDGATRTDAATPADAAKGTHAGGRVVLVTGASRGIGAVLADAFEAVGDTVERGSRAVAEVTDPAQVDAWVGHVVARHGRIDVLVNNAGVMDEEVPLWEADPDRWWQAVEVNVRGPFLLTRAVVPHMLAAGGGRVLNLNSGSGTRANDVATAYHVGKTALARITGATHLAGAERGVLAFDLAPGVVRTDMTLAMRAHEGRTEWTSPEEVTALALALASGELDAWSGRFVRAGVDTPESLREAASRLQPQSRTIGLLPWGSDDPQSA